MEEQKQPEITDYPDEDGVVVPEEAVKDSEIKKWRKKRTLGQLPAYKDMVNVKYFTILILKESPSDLKRYVETVVANASEACKSIGFAHASHTEQDATWYLDCALVLVQDIRSDYSIMKKLGIVSNDTYKKSRALIKGVIAQLISWRDYENGVCTKGQKK